MQSLVASGFYMLVLVAALLGAAYAVVYPIVPWGEVLNASSPAVAQLAGPAVAVLVGMTLVGIPLASPSGFGWAFRSRSLPTSGCRSAASSRSKPWSSPSPLGAPLPWLVFAFACGPLSASLLNCASLLRSRPWLVPRPRNATVAQGRHLLSLGLLFFIVQVAGVVAYRRTTSSWRESSTLPP